MDNLPPNANDGLIMEITGDPQAIYCNEMLGFSERPHQGVSKGSTIAIFTFCIDEEGNRVDYTEDEVYSIALHEFAHGLGLGHAFHMNGDLMCSSDYDNAGNEIETCADKPGREEPSENDIMALLYKYGKDGFSQPNREIVGYRPVYEPGTPIE